MSKYHFWYCDCDKICNDYLYGLKPKQPLSDFYQWLLTGDILDVEELKDMIFNNKWIIFPMSSTMCAADIINSIKIGMKPVFMKPTDYRRFKEEYENLM